MRFDWTTVRTAPELVAVALFWAFFFAQAAPIFARRGPKLSRIAAISRLLFATLLAAAFLEPVFVRTVAEKTPLILLLDDSASAARPLDGGATVWSRTVAAARLVDEIARKRGLTVAPQTLSGQTFANVAELPGELSNSGRFFRSPLRDAGKIALETAAPRQNFAPKSGTRRVLLLSDGIADETKSLNDAQVSTRQAFRVELDAASIGISRPAFDWRLENFAATTSVFPGENAAFSVDLRLENAPPNAPRRAVARLWAAPRENVAETENFAPKLVFERAVAVETDENGAASTRLEDSWTPERDAVFDYFLFVADFEDAEKTASFDAGKNDAFDFFEFCPFNNAATFSVVPKREKLAVLLIDDEPRYEYRYLRDLLRREETVELKTLLLGADDATRTSDETAFPIEKFDRRTLAKFDVILLGDVSPERLGPGRLERLADVVLRDDSATSLWLLPGERTSTPEFWRDSVANRFAPNADLTPFNANNADTTLSERRFSVETTRRGREIFPELARFFAEKNAEPLEIFRVFPTPTPGPGSEILLSTRDENGSETPLFVLSSPGKNKILRQATDEIWRLRTLDDKTLYRRFVLRALEILTAETDANGAPIESNDNRISTKNRVETPLGEPSENVSRFEKYFFKDAAFSRADALRETADVAARADVLAENAAQNGGLFLDLRDKTPDESRAVATAFFERRFDDFPEIFAEKRTPLAPKNVAFPLAILLFVAAWTLERAAETKKFRENSRRNG